MPLNKPRDFSSETGFTAKLQPRGTGVISIDTDEQDALFMNDLQSDPEVKLQFKPLKTTTARTQ
jgi:hypothetical protein